MISLLCFALLILAFSHRDPLARKRRQWAAENNIGPALQRRWLRR